MAQKYMTCFYLHYTFVWFSVLLIGSSLSIRVLFLISGICLYITGFGCILVAFLVLFSTHYK